MQPLNTFLMAHTRQQAVKFIEQVRRSLELACDWDSFVNIIMNATSDGEVIAAINGCDWGYRCDNLVQLLGVEGMLQPVKFEVVREFLST